MKITKIAVLLMFLASVAVTQNGLAGVRSGERQQWLFIETPKGTPGPLCWPGDTCIPQTKEHPGPLCWPGIGYPLEAKTVPSHGAGRV